MLLFTSDYKESHGRGVKGFRTKFLIPTLPFFRQKQEPERVAGQAVGDKTHAAGPDSYTSSHETQPSNADRSSQSLAAAE